MTFYGQMGLNEVEACWNTKKRTPATTPAKQLKHEEDQQISETEVLIPPIGAGCTSCALTGVSGGLFCLVQAHVGCCFSTKLQKLQVKIIWQQFMKGYGI